jgi:CheY-like chemotaxis protein
VDYGIREGHRPLHREAAAVNPAPEPYHRNVLSPEPRATLWRARAPAGTTVLVIEGHAPQRQSLAATLRSEGYAVVAVNTLDEGLACLRTGDVDLVLLDMMLPAVGGWHCLDRLRMDPSLASPLPAVIATGVALAREWALSFGCASFLAEPVRPKALLKEVRRYLADRR